MPRDTDGRARSAGQQFVAVADVLVPGLATVNRPPASITRPAAASSRNPLRTRNSCKPVLLATSAAVEGPLAAWSIACPDAMSVPSGLTHAMDGRPYSDFLQRYQSMDSYPSFKRSAAISVVLGVGTMTLSPGRQLAGVATL